ncbi:unnamed protein product [Oikopleura dioica]|uniref:Uncharacterized protein n=1 Tax=Oikopleura dioica TaxID=34765 RepID=E4WT12_OIKDI|nr:unnamed protein product [Oikopleura dioica]
MKSAFLVNILALVSGFSAQNEWNWRAKREVSPTFGDMIRARRNFMNYLNVPQRRQFDSDFASPRFARQARYRAPIGFGKGIHLRKRASLPAVSLPVLEELARRSWYSGI